LVEKKKLWLKNQNSGRSKFLKKKQNALKNQNSGRKIEIFVNTLFF